MTWCSKKVEVKFKTQYEEDKKWKETFSQDQGDINASEDLYQPIASRNAFTKVLPRIMIFVIKFWTKGLVPTEDGGILWNLQGSMCKKHQITYRYFMSG